MPNSKRCAYSGRLSSLRSWVTMSSMPKNKQIPVIYLFLACTTLVAFWQVIHCDFIVYDDPKYVTENIHIRHGITIEAIRWAFTTGHRCELASCDMDIPHARYSTLWIKAEMASSDQSFIPHCKYTVALFRFSPDDQSALEKRFRGGFVCPSPPPRGIRRLGGRTKGCSFHFFLDAHHGARISIMSSIRGSRITWLFSYFLLWA